MRLIEKLKQIERIDNLIRRKSTGTPKELAVRLKISERALYHCLDLMKDMKAPVYYCSSQQSYCYEYKGSFVFGFEPHDRARAIVGGTRRIVSSNDISLQKLCSDITYLTAVNGH